MRLTRLYIVLVSLAAYSLAGASSLFEDEEVLDVELTGPLHTLVKQKDEREEFPFVLRVDGTDHNIKVRARGKSRLRVCDFPPLRLNFETGGMQETEFSGQDGLKVVTHCRNRDSGDQNVLEEYTAYRIFSLFSDVSYRVRLLRMTYRDTDHRLKKGGQPHFGFVIEPKAHLSERTGAVPLSLSGLPIRRINRDQAALVYVFQYLIGNTDWSFVLADDDNKCCHNGDLFEIDREIYYVPYDFDLAGLVNATYAKPDPSLRLRNVRTRRYRGYCTDRQTLKEALRTVKSMQTEVLNVVNETPGFSEKQLKKSVEYVTKFFEEAENEEKLLNLYEKRCID